MKGLFWIFLLMLLTDGESVDNNNTTMSPLPQTQGRRPSIWSKTVHHLRRNHYRKPYLRRSTEMRPVSTSEEETQFLNSAPVLSLKEFANQLVNDTATFFKSTPRARSYPGTGAAGSEDPAVTQQQQQQLWDDKDQAYHASSYAGLDYEPPTSYHHPFGHGPPPPVHYYPVPHKKDDTLFTKVALIALLKLILAKLKAIGFLKILLLFFLKVPILFFKMLIVFKGFKFLKLLSIPFLILAFGIPFLPLIPFFFLSFLPFLFFAPLAVPLLLPLLMFLPIIPVTTPPTAGAVTGRKRRDLDINQPLMANHTWSVLDQHSNRTRKMFRTRGRPVSEARRQSSSRYEPYLNQETPENILELTQRVVQSQQCLERAACEIASYNDSKIYQSAVIWALGKLQTYAPPNVQRKLEDYAHAYENGIQRRSGNYCSQRFQCSRPKIVLIQGSHTYNVL